jgi:hypothetical protein
MITRTVKDAQQLEKALQKFHADTSVKAKQLPSFESVTSKDANVRLSSFLKAIESLPAHYRWTPAVKTFLAPRLDDDLTAVRAVASIDG